MAVSMRRIRVAADEIAQAFRPQKIVLFGSHARGRGRKDSDLDLLIVADGPDPPELGGAILERLGG